MEEAGDLGVEVMNSKKTLLMLVLLIAVVLGYLYFDTRSAVEERELSVVSEPLVQGVSENDVLKIQVINPGKSFSAYRPGFKIGADGKLLKGAEIADEWVMSDPDGAPTIPGTLPEFLERLFAVSVKNSVMEDAVSGDQSIYGLQPPEYVVTLQGEFEKRVLSFGKKHEISGRRYVQKENDARILLIDETDFEQLLLSRDEVRSKRPLQFEAEKVSSVTILRRGSDIPLVLKRVSKEPLRWQLTAAGVDVDADAELIEKQLKKLSEIEVERFLAPTLAPLQSYGLQDPRLVLRLAFEGEEEGENEMLLQFAEAAEAEVPLPENGGTKTVGLYFFRVSFQTWIYQIATPEFRGWLQSPEHFRDTKPFSNLSLSDASAITVRKDKEALRLVKGEEGDWYIGSLASAEKKKVGEASFQTWFERLSKVRILSYPSLSQGDRKLANFESPVFSVTVEKNNSRIPFSLIVGGALKAVNAVEGEGIDPNAPRYGLLTGEDKRQVAVVVSAALIKDLAQNSEYFLHSKSAEK